MNPVQLPADPVPNFICPACGYFGETTWDSYATEELGEERLAFGCRELLGMMLIDHLLGYPFSLACLHPDGTYGYGPEAAPGIRREFRGWVMTRTLTMPAEVQAFLHAMGPQQPLHEVMGDAAIEHKIYRTLAGLLYATYHPLAPPHPLIDFQARFRQESASIMDCLSNLSPASPLARYYDEDDTNFTALQRHVWELLAPHYWHPHDVLLDWTLEEHHVLRPSEITTAFTDPAEADTTADDA
jgi:hypothetical protein